MRVDIPSGEIQSRVKRWLSYGPRGRGLDILCVVLLIGVTVFSWIPRCRGPIDLRWDAGAYYVLGTSLAEGKGYRLLNEPGDILAIQYPPLLPAIVAIHQKVLQSGDPVIVGRWLRITWILFSISSVVICFLLSRLFLPRRYCVLLCLFSVLSYQIYFVSTLCFAELPFTVASLLCFYLYYRPGRAALGNVGVAVTAVAAYLLRTIGIALLAAWVAEALFTKRFRTAVVRGVVAFIPIFAWQSYIRSVENGSTYRQPYYSYQRDPSMFYNVSYATNLALRSPFQPELGNASFQDLGKRFLDNVIAIPYRVGESLTSTTLLWRGYLDFVNKRFASGSISFRWVSLLITFVGFAALAGVALLLWQRFWLCGVYLVLTLAAVCVTPWPGQVVRYLSPAVPLLLIALFSFVNTAESWAAQRLQRVGRNTVRAFTAGVTLTVMFGALASLATTYRNFLDPMTYRDRNGVAKPYLLIHSPAAFDAMEDAMLWISTHTEPNSVVAVSMPHWVYLNTNRKTVMPPLESDPAKAQGMLDSVPVSYFILEHMFMEQDFNQGFSALVRGAPDRWTLVYSKRGVLIYKRAGALASAHSESKAH